MTAVKERLTTETFTINRKSAMVWWDSLTVGSQITLAKLYYDRNPKSLTGREIQEIWEQSIVQY